MPASRYNSLAIILHWVMALAILLMLASGLTMGYITLEPAFKFKLYQWHKSLGVLVLWAATLRLGIRLFNKPPTLPASFPKYEVVLSKLGHWGLYALMFALPISGWMMVSSSIYGLPTIVFGWFEWPHIPGIAANAEVSNFAKGAHWWLAMGMLVLLAGHIGAVVKHAVVDKHNLLTHMWWGRG